MNFKETLEKFYHRILAEWIYSPRTEGRKRYSVKVR